MLFPTDFSPESLAALPYACAIAHEFTAQLLLLHVLPAETANNPEAPRLGEPLLARMKEFAARVVQPSCRPEFLVDSGPEADAILTMARGRNVGLIVIGLRHGSACASLHGTVAYKTIAQASCPVLTIRSSK